MRAEPTSDAGAGAAACGTITHDTRRYVVFKYEVVCGAARVTALRMLRRQQPYAAGAGRAWRCRILGAGEEEHGSCETSADRRWVLYLPAAA